MVRATFNLIVDVAAAVSLVGMIATGFILRYPLPANMRKTHTLWGLTRNQWGDIHFWMSAALVSILVTHLVLHWRWVVATIGHRMGVDATHHPARIGLVLLAALAAILIGFGWAAHQGVRPIAVPDRQSSGLAPAKASGDFWEEVYPVFERSCVSCHGPRRAAGGFRVDQRDSMIGPDPHDRWVVPGDPDKSPIMGVVSGARPGLPYPDRHRLSTADLEVIRRWISAGAPGPNDPSDVHSRSPE